MMREIYLDYAASTSVDERVVSAMQPFFTEAFANPAAKHAPGVRAKQALEEARASVAQILDVEPEEILFTASGTASLNAAVLGAGRAVTSRDIWASPMEHNAVLEPARAQEKEGKRLHFFTADEDGQVRPADVGSQTALVSVMLANNEVGTIQDIAKFADIAHRAGALMHTDASQAAPTVRIRPRSLSADLLSLDGQKIYGPKGVGVLYVRKGLALAPYFWGSGQERGIAPGTENLPAIVGFAAALRLADDSVEGESRRIASLRETLERGIRERIKSAVVIAEGAQRAAHISTIAFPGLERDVMQAFLSTAGVYVSTGAACEPRGRGGISHVLEAMEIDASLAQGALRFSLGRPTTEGEITEAVLRVAEVFHKLNLS